MKKENKIILGIFISLVIIGGAAWAYFSWWVPKKEKEKAKGTTSGGLLAGAGNNSGNLAGNLDAVYTNPGITDAFPLHQGSNGLNVKLLQHGLNIMSDISSAPIGIALVADGDYGVKTVAAVNKMKAFAKITQDGIVTQSEYDKYIQPFVKYSNDGVMTPALAYILSVLTM